MAVRAASLKIILRSFENEKEISSLDIEAFREVLEELDRNYDSLKESDFANVEWLREKILRAAGQDVIKTVPLEFAKPGLTLVKAVHNAAGLVLAGEGTVFSEEMMQRLEDQDIYWINVKPGPQTFLEIPPVITDPDERTDKIQAEPDHRFESLEHNHRMTLIKDAALRFLVSAKDSHPETG